MSPEWHCSVVQRQLTFFSRTNGPILFCMQHPEGRGNRIENFMTPWFVCFFFFLAKSVKLKHFFQFSSLLLSIDQSRFYQNFVNFMTPGFWVLVLRRPRKGLPKNVMNSVAGALEEMRLWWAKNLNTLKYLIMDI